MKIKSNFYIVFFLLLISISKTYSQLSNLHYIPPLTSGQSNAIFKRQYLYISTPETSNVDVQITPIGGATFNITVSNSSPYRLDIDNEVLIRWRATLSSKSHTDCWINNK